jgi:hypothetical protein
MEDGGIGHRGGTFRMRRPIRRLRGSFRASGPRLKRGCRPRNDRPAVGRRRRVAPM